MLHILLPPRSLKRKGTIVILNPLGQIQVPTEILSFTVGQLGTQNRDLAAPLNGKGNVFGRFGKVGTVPCEVSYIVWNKALVL